MVSLNYNKQRRALRTVGRLLVRNTKKQLTKLDKVVTGKTINSVDYKISGFVDPELTLIADETLKFIDEGRKPGGKMPPEEPIIEWIKRRKIKGRDARGRFIKRKSLAFLIRRSIAKKGIKPTNIIEKVLTKSRKRIDKILTKAIREDVNISIFDEVSKI